MERTTHITSFDPIPMFRIKDPISALTHFIGFVCAIAATPLLLVQASLFSPGPIKMISLSVFMLSMVLLYGASTAYHTFLLSSKGQLRLKRLDHMMIFILIAGSYTPVCTIVLGPGSGSKMLLLVWTLALLGILFKAFWVTCPKWVSSVIYIGMGWVALFAIVPLFRSLCAPALFWLITGGVLYTAGGVIYALKKNLFPHIPGFGAHELFHIFVMLGSFCHYMLMFRYLCCY